MLIYLASRYSRREELCDFRESLEARGHTVTSRWLNGNHQVTDDGLNAEGSEEERRRFALEDLQDLEACDCLIAFTEPPRSGPTRGGRHVEFGIAIALRKILVIVGPRENVFHCLPRVHVCKTASDALLLFAGPPPWSDYLLSGIDDLSIREPTSAASRPPAQQSEGVCP